MTSLLGINFGSHRQAYFQVRVTIHELNNVPMVAGEFKAKWRIDHAQHLPVAAASVAGPSEERTLHHKKSTSTLASQATTANGGGGGGGGGGVEENNGSVDSGSLRVSRDDASSTYSASKRKGTAPKLFSGLRDAFGRGSSPGGETSSKSERSSPPSTSERPSIDEGELHGHARREGSSTSIVDILSHEPRGETSSAHVGDNRVVWDRRINVGVKMGVEKARVASGGSGSSDSQPRRSTVGESSSSSSSTAAAAQTANNSSNANVAWGQLSAAEMRITVKADVPTGIEAQREKTTLRLGNIAVNLAEFAPIPHQHHHVHQKRHSRDHSSNAEHLSSSHHHHHHHHHHALHRQETRRYLLQDGPTNATIKVTVEMTHVGGSRDYVVPSNKRGLLLTNAAESAVASTSQDGEKSDSTTTTTASATAKVFHDWYPHGVARHTRIPDSNLNTQLSHKDTARAVKEAGVGARLAFSFATGAHHDRPPEDVIDALFKQQDFAFTPRPSRTREKKLSFVDSRSPLPPPVTNTPPPPPPPPSAPKVRDMVR